VTELPVKDPSVTLVGRTPAGGGGGESVSSVKVTVSPLVPCAAETGEMVVIWLAIWPAERVVGIVASRTKRTPRETVDPAIPSKKPKLLCFMASSFPLRASNIA